MIRTLPQHNITNPPGQIDNSKELDKLAYKSHPKTLGDVIDNVKLHEELLMKKKLMFGEWAKSIGYDEFSDHIGPMETAWYAAQKNM